MSSPPYYKEIDEELKAVRSEKEAAIDGQEFEKAARFRDSERKLVAQRRELEKAWREGKLAYTGRVGAEVSTEQAVDAARLAALAGLAQLKEAAGGDLARVRLVRLDGHVGCTMEFKDIPHVLNGASELLTQVLGVAHCRTALGHMVMPLDSPVMLGFLAEIDDAST